MLTIFSAPKPFRDPNDRIQRNAIRSWLALGSDVQIILLGSEEGLPEAAVEFGLRLVEDVERNEQGTPLVSSIFAAAQSAAQHDLLCYVNADILLLDDLLPAVKQVASTFDRFLLVGQRWDLEVDEALDFDRESRLRLRDRVSQHATLHPPAGSDYFVFRKGGWDQMPPFALGRAGWDNWMIYAARAAGAPVVDASQAITAVHQTHDYSHLPGGQPHYRMPESERNVKLAGGREMIFTLADANWRLGPEGLRRQRIGTRGPLRTVEAALYAALGPGRTAKLVRLVMHPWETVRYYARGVG